MKKNVLITIAILSFIISFSQTEKANYKKVVSAFKLNYNKGDYKSIYNMLDANFQKTLTLEKTETFFKTNINAKKLGKIKSFNLKEIIKTGHSYKVTFQNGIGEAFFLLDNKNKISGLLMYPPKQ